MRMPHFDFSRLDPRRLFHRGRTQPAVAAAGSASMAPARSGGSRPAGEASLRVPEDRLPAAPGSPEYEAHQSASASTAPIPIPGAEANGSRSRVRFAPDETGGHESTGEHARSRSGSVSGLTTRSASPPPDYPDSASETGSVRISPLPLYEGGRLHHGETRMTHDGIPMPATPESQRDYGRATPSPLDLGTPLGGRSPVFSGSPGSMGSEQLEAYLDSLPPLSRFPTPPPRDGA